MTRRTAYQLARQTVKEFLADNAPRLGAAMAFYTALSLAPVLLVVIGIAGLAFGEQAARGEIAHQIANLVGKEQAEVVQDMLKKSAGRGGGVLATVIGFATLLVGATGLFAELQGALDTVWNVKPDPDKSGIRATVKDRLLSFAMIGVMAFLLLVSLVFSAVVSGLGEAFERWLPYSSVWLQAANVAVSLVVTTLMFAMIFKVLPHARPAWSDVWVGAALTAVLFTIGKYLIGLYLGRASVGSTFGAAGSFVVLLVWVYYSTQILLLGAEFTQVYALRHGSGVKAVAGLTPADPSNPSGAGAQLHPPPRADEVPAAPPAATPEPVI
jgi:membrane protein